MFAKLVPFAIATSDLGTCLPFHFCWELVGSVFFQEKDNGRVASRTRK